MLFVIMEMIKTRAYRKCGFVRSQKHETEPSPAYVSRVAGYLDETFRKATERNNRPRGCVTSATEVHLLVLQVPGVTRFATASETSRVSMLLG